MNQVLFILVGAVAGIFGGMFGIGGATIMIPALVYLFSFTQHQAQGTTLAVMVPPIAILAAWRYWQAGNVKLGLTGLICIGWLFGGLIGANLAHHVSDPVLKKLFGVFLLFISIKMMFGK
ncbi:MAG: sulfite exporter TauE/SafE family protein [Candidatus Omnitrophica bacterium]|nr:sulfite exporter TauE/SafE family protein [Candidatus Omnitrophota bacterium]